MTTGYALARRSVKLGRRVVSGAYRLARRTSTIQIPNHISIAWTDNNGNPHTETMSFQSGTLAGNNYYWASADGTARIDSNAGDYTGGSGLCALTLDSCYGKYFSTPDPESHSFPVSLTDWYFQDASGDPTPGFSVTTFSVTDWMNAP